MDPEGHGEVGPHEKYKVPHLGQGVPRHSCRLGREGTESSPRKRAWE